MGKLELISTNFCQPTMDFIWRKGNENFQFKTGILQLALIIHY